MEAAQKAEGSRKGTRPMKMYFFRCEIPNFGDELNEWLLPRVFPGFFDEKESELFLGIGSILYDDHPPAATKIVFGSGYGGYTNPPVIDQTWRIYGVRGPLTAQRLGLDKKFVAADSAILINKFYPKENQRRGVSFIPHFESINRGEWQRACLRAGIEFIDPRWPVEKVLAAISSSEFVISEAMHGAIVADALRVPWIAMRPIDSTHRMKWSDWANALDMDVHFQNIPPSSLREMLKLKLVPRTTRIQNAKGLTRQLLGVGDGIMVEFAAHALRKLARGAASMSSDAALDRALDRLQSDAERIRRDFPSS